MSIFSRKYSIGSVFCSIVDLRWGIREHATDDHRTTDICLSEIDKCISSTIFGAPCFIYLGFDRYGAPSLPRLVPKDEMEHLVSSIKVITMCMQEVPRLFPGVATFKIERLKNYLYSNEYVCL